MVSISAYDSLTNEVILPSDCNELTAYITILVHYLMRQSCRVVRTLRTHLLLTIFFDRLKVVGIRTAFQPLSNRKQ